MVEASVRNEYKEANFDNPVVINPNHILAHFVWLPRYKYAVQDGGGFREAEISIVFENKNTAKSTGTGFGTNYLTHPAFTFGDDELNGLWVGKF